MSNAVVNGIADRLRRIAPLIFIAFIVILIVSVSISIVFLKKMSGLLISFDLAMLGYIAGAIHIMGRTPSQIRIYALRNNVNRSVILLVTALTALVVLTAVSLELMKGRTVSDVTLSIFTLTVSWTFANVVWAMHYAHMFYLEHGEVGESKLINFPGKDFPTYKDFLYFSFTLGTSFQTSDVEIRSNRLRRIVLGHCMTAFVFNIGVIGLTVNLLNSAFT